MTVNKLNEMSVPHRHGVDADTTDVTATSPPLAEQSGVDTTCQQAETANPCPSSRLLAGCTCGGRDMCTVCVLADLYAHGDTLALTMMATALDATERALARPTNVVPLHGHSVKR